GSPRQAEDLHLARAQRSDHADRRDQPEVRAAPEIARLRRHVPRVRGAARRDAGDRARRLRVVPDVKEKRKKKAREAAARPLLTLAGLPLVGHLARSHWKALTLALVAVMGETFADVLGTWPIKIVVDNILQGKKLPPRLDAIVALFPQNTYATLNFALTAVLAIAVIGAISSYSEKLLTTSVAQWVGHDLRRMVYQRIQRLSLAEHGESRTGDLLTRVTS